MRRPVLFLLLAVLAFVTMGQESCDTTTGGGDEPQVEKNAKKKKSGKGSKPDRPDAKVGDRLTLKGTSYLVNDVKTAKTVGDPDLGGARANGRFVIVSLELTNNKDEPKSILADNVRLIGGKGNEYSVSSDVITGVKKPLFIAEDIQPDSPEQVTAVYDVPQRAVKDSQLQVQDLFSEAKGTIDLGL